MIKRQSGAGLIEVLVAALITAIGILGYAGMQVQTVGEATNAQLRMQALALAGDLVSRVRANNSLDYSSGSSLQVYESANYKISGTASSCTNVICNSEQLAHADVFAMHNQLTSLLPAGDMTFKKDPAKKTYMVRVAWNGQEANNQCDSPQLNDENQFQVNCVVLEVVIPEKYI